LPSKLRSITRFIGQRPTLTVLVFGLILFTILLSRGLDIGPLQTDVIIIRAWFHDVGVSGFSQKYFEVNQRHILAGPLIAFAYSLFGESDLAYNAIFQLSRVFEGVFLAGIVYHISGRRVLAVSAGLALMTTVIRVGQLYQGINWFIEPTLAMLLASSYFHLLSLKNEKRRIFYYGLSLTVYFVSILIYESGIPWVVVNLFLGYVARDSLSVRQRLWLTLRDNLPAIIAGATLTYMVIFVFTPWTGLAPDPQAASPLRVLSQLTTIVTLPTLYADTLRMTIRDGYSWLILLFAVLAALVAVVCASRYRLQATALRTYGILLLLAAVMVLASILVGTSNQIGQEYLDRITFGRAAGIMLLYTTIIFAITDLLRKQWSETLAAAIVSLLLIGPGFAFMWIHQDYANQARAEVDRLVPAIKEVRQLIYLPAHLVVHTEPDWVLAKWTDASDAVLHDTQDKLYKANEPATLDFLKTGVYYENIAMIPGTCNALNGQASAGMCLDEKGVLSTRWAAPKSPTEFVHPYEDIVIVHWDAKAGKLNILKSLKMPDLTGYNITTAGRTELSTNPDRVAVPIP
jgi:hypothetical protein